MSASALSVAVDAAAPQVLPEVRKRRRSRYGKNPKRGPVNVERFLEEGVERVECRCLAGVSGTDGA